MKYSTFSFFHVHVEIQYEFLGIFLRDSLCS